MRPPESFEYYTNTIYWNDFELVREYINRQISGSKNVDWQRYVYEKFGTFNRGFFLNCGNGWVERDLFRIGAVKSVVGIDYSEKTILEAKEEARKLNMPAQYTAADINNLAPCVLSFDLVVNHAAMHHVAFINRVTCQLARMITQDGHYIAFDYVGPHRNQYPTEMWSAIQDINSALPRRFQANLSYPHVRTTLQMDPTEAIHSELQLEVMKRYFNVQEYAAVGGQIAYHILYNNKALFEERHTAEGIATLESALDADMRFCASHPEWNLFAFWVATPKRETFPDQARINEWQKEEDERETEAARNGGRYYPPTALEIAYEYSALQLQALQHCRDDLLCKLENVQRENTVLREQIKGVEKSRSWRITAPLRALKKALIGR